MNLFRRWLSPQLRVRYWKRRARRAETILDDALLKNAQEVTALREALEAEKWRNLSREDSFVSATIMGGRNMWGVPPRSGPAIKQAGYGTTAPRTGDVWDSLSYADKAEFEMFWKPDAEAAGVPLQQAKPKFLAEKARRRALNDEPIG